MKTDSEILQEKFDEAHASNKRMADFDLEGRTWHIDQTIYYRLGTNSRRYRLFNGTIIIQGNIDGIAPDPSLQGMKIDGSSDANNASKYLCRFDIDRVVFRGGRNAVIQAAQRGSVISNCAFELCGRGVLGVWAQQCKIENTQFQFNVVEDFCYRSGVSDGTLMNEWGVLYEPNNDRWFSNSTSSNSQSNRSGTKDCWHYGRPFQICQARIQGSDGFTMENPIFEGSAPEYCIYADSRGSTTVRTINIIRAHIETGDNETKALMYVKNFPNTYISQLYSQIHDVPVLEFEGNIGQVYFDNLTYIPWSARSFKSQASIKWVFNQPAQGAENPATRNVWDGTVPKNISYLEGNDISAIGSRGISLMARPAYKTGQEGIIISDNAVQVRHPSIIHDKKVKLYPQ